MAFIEPSKIYTYFKNNYNLKKTSKGWHAFSCPICNEDSNRKKMAVHFIYKKVKCWVCGYNEFVTKFVSDIEGLDHNKSKELLNKCKPSAVNLDIESIESDRSGKVLATAKLPVGFNSLMDGDGVLGVRARTYVSDRGFDPVRMDNMGFGYCNKKADTEESNYFGYLMIPFKDKGRLVYYIGRDYIGNFLRYKNPDKGDFSVGKGDIFFNEDAIHLYDEVFVLEGWADAFTIGDNAIASLGWKLSVTQISKLIKSEVDIITLVPDSGFDGQGVSFYIRALELALQLIDHKLVKVVDPKQFVGGKDVNEIGRDSFMKAYNNCEVLDGRSIALKILED